MEGARVGRPVAEERDGDALLAAHLERESRSNDARKTAAHDGVRAQISDLEVVEVHRAAVAPAAAFDLAVQLGHDALHRSPLRDRVSVRSMRRGDHVLLRKSGANACRRGLLADRDMEEPGQLACAEAVLDLLLEAADQEHLAEETAQDFLGDASPPGFGSLLDGRHRAAIMLIRRCEPPISGRRSRRRSTPIGPRPSSRSHPKDPIADAAAVLGPLQPGRLGDHLRLHITRSGGGVERARNIFRRLDGRRIWGTLALVGVIGDVAPAAATPARAPAQPLADAWDGALSQLPPDWSDLLCDLELDSTDHVPRAALLGAPLNPSRVPGETALRFRASGKQGYGVSPVMARRCFERMDAEGITGSLNVLYDLSDTGNAVTQGPVWRLAGRSV